MTLGSFSNNGLAFGVAFTLHDAFSQTAANIQQSMARLTGATTAMQDRMSSELNRITAGAAMFGAALAVLVPIGWGVEQAGIMEQVRISFETIMGSASQAGKLIKDLRFFADWTPFETMETLKAGKSLLAYGVSADKIIPTLTNLGNVASGLNLHLDDLIQVYGRNLSQPYIFSRDIYQFAMRGIDIMGALSEVLKVPRDSILELASNRGIKPDAMVKAFELIGGAGGKFNNMMVRQSQTFQGLMSTLHSYIQQTFEAIGNQFLPTLKELSRVFISLAKWVTAFVNTPLGGWILKTVGALAALTAALGLLSIAIGGARLMGLQLVWMFSAATRQAILTTIATRGLTAGMWQMATAVWAALSPILVWLVPLALLIYLIYAAVKAFNDMDTSAEGLRNAGAGYMGWLRSIGGYIMGLIEVLKTWNGKEFTLSDDMVRKMDALGILENFMALATWVVRIKTYLDAMWDGFAGTLEYVWTNIMRPMLIATESLLESIGIKIDKAGGSLEAWAAVGRTLGRIFGAIWAIVGVGLTLSLGIVAGIMYGIVKLAEFLWWIIKGIFDFVVWVIDGIWGVVKDIGSFLGNIGKTALSVLPGGDTLVRFMEASSMQNTNSDQSNVVPAPSSSYNYFNDLGFGAAGYEGRASAPAVGPQRQPAPVVVPAPTVNNQIFLDGEMIFGPMQERQQLQNARRD